MALTEKDLKKWQKVCDHLTRMDNDAEYCKEIEKKLYLGAPNESIERIRQAGIKNGSIKVSKRNKKD